MVKFLVDFMLGKLARQLRMFGFDTEYIKPQTSNNYNPLSLIKIAQHQERIILTRNTKLKDYSCVLFIENEETKDQIRQIVNHFKIDKEIKAFSRCIVCNELLTPISKPAVKGKVPFYIFQTKDEFSFCPKCNKIYWQGSHLKDMKKRMGEII